LAQCQEMSFGRGADCFRNPSLGSAADAYIYAPSVRKTYAYGESAAPRLNFAAGKAPSAELGLKQSAADLERNVN
jgi:hypothetical protein